MFITSLLLSVFIDTGNIKPAKIYPPSAEYEFDISSNVLGVDANENIIRDDIDAYLLKTYTDPKQLKVIQDYAQRMQYALVLDPTDATDLRNNQLEALGDVVCFQAFDKDGRIQQDILNVTFNTKERQKALRKYEKALKGTTFASPDECRYDHLEQIGEAAI